MVKWIGKLSLLLNLLRDAWMDMLPLSAMSEDQRQNQYLADVCVVRHAYGQRSGVPWGLHCGVVKHDVRSALWGSLRVSRAALEAAGSGTVPR